MKNILIKPLKFSAFFILCFFLNSSIIISQTDNNTYTISSGGTTNNNVFGVYVQGGVSNAKPYYTKISGTTINPCFVFFAAAYWNISAVLNDNDANVYYYNSNGLANSSGTFPAQTYDAFWTPWTLAPGTQPPATVQNSTANMTFSDGSGYTPPVVTLGTNNNPVGRFQLTGSAAGGVLKALTISLTGTRSGITAVKLWSSIDNSFSSGSDVQLGSQSDGASVSFSSFNSLVDNSSGTYYFVTVDLTGGATGSFTATIPSQASFTFVGANAPTSFTDAALGTAPLPVELSSFTALAANNSVNLNWSTATEINNYGFQVERKKEKVESEWEEISFVQGHGNSNSPKQYSFVDKNPLAGKSQYRLKQIDNDGAYKYSDAVEVNVNVVQFALKQNYPNPFNPVTTISYSLPEKTNVTLSIFNVLGQEVAKLVNKEEEGGVHNVEFNGSEFNSGIYFYKLTAGNYSEVKKLMLLK